ncbi:Uncharacterised protein [Clostridium tetanomorphum]|nr:Uncharacterised protein [Clostridium tetanomorphum]
MNLLQETLNNIKPADKEAIKKLGKGWTVLVNLLAA